MLPKKSRQMRIRNQVSTYGKVSRDFPIDFEKSIRLGQWSDLR